MKRILIALLLTGCAGSAPEVATDPRPEPAIQSGSSVLTALRWVSDNTERFDFGDTGGLEFESSRHWEGGRIDDDGEPVDTHGLSDGWFVDTENHGRLWLALNYTFETDRQWHLRTVLAIDGARRYICGGDGVEGC